MKAHPILMLVIIGCWLICFALSFTLMPDDYSDQRRFSMGFFGGLFCALCVLTGRLFRVED